MITEKQIEILNFLTDFGTVTGAELAKGANIRVGNLHKAMEPFRKLGLCKMLPRRFGNHYIVTYQITRKGKAVLDAMNTTVEGELEEENAEKQ